MLTGAIPAHFVLIVGGHAILIAAVMTAKMTIPPIVPDPPIIIDSIKLPPDPPPVPEPPVSKKPQLPPESATYIPPNKSTNSHIRWADHRHNERPDPRSGAGRRNEPVS